MSLEGAKLIPVVIASTLKPIEDVRAFQKLALSLGETNKYSLNIIGFSSEKAVEVGNYRFFSSMSHFGSKVDRVLAQVRFAKKLLDLKPKLLICCTFEYLPLASFFKPILGYQLIYDVQENYAKNLELNPTLSGWKKKLAKLLIKKSEGVKSIDLFLLAEACYRVEMSEKKPFLILENKYQGEIRTTSPIRLDPGEELRFAITGTISPAFGTLEGLIWFQKLLETYPHFQLQIIGHCPLGEYRKQIQEQAKLTPQVHLRISESPIPYSAINNTLTQTDLALFPYHDHPAIREKMPTKIYECAALGIPVLISPNEKWADFLMTFSGGFSVDFNQSEQAAQTFQQVLAQTYFSTSVPESVLWKTERLHFQKAIQNLLP